MFVCVCVCVCVYVVCIVLYCISFFHFDLHVVKLSKTDYLHRKTNLKYFITTNRNIKKDLKSPN